MITLITALDERGDEVTLAADADTSELRQSGSKWWDLEVEAESVRPCAGSGCRQRAHWRHPPGSYYRERRLLNQLMATIAARR